MAELQSISPAALAKLSAEQPQLAVIDVRSPAEYRAAHVSFATLAPLASLNPARLAADLRARPNDPIYIFCQSGTRANTAAQKLIAHAYQNVVVVDGGVDAWDRAGLPLVRGRKTISLERQVRIAAGSLVLIGIILGFSIHRAFFGVSTFVGAGLVFAGITDFCGMGLLLARMPWNQRVS